MAAKSAVELCGEKMFVFELGYEELEALSRIMDLDGSWEDLAGVMKDSAKLVILLRQCEKKGGQSPTSELLRVYGSRGHPVENLAKLLAKIRHVEALRILQDLVDSALFSRLLKRAESGGAEASSQRLGESAPFASSKPSRQESSSKCSPSLPASSLSNQASASQVTTGASAAGLQNTLSVPYEELRLATNNFDASNLIGKGGYGMVYKGLWKHNRVAVKRIAARRPDANSAQAAAAERERLRQSLAELRTLGLYRHDHVLPLYAYSLDGPEPLLLYQFMANGSLEDRLRLRENSVPLSWEQRKAIAIGTAKGLHFLHDSKPEPLIHGDIKSANILLDEHFAPKLGDFGLCRQGKMLGSDAEPLIVSHIKGTLAYLPPEFLRSKHLSTKLDVFSFGIVLLELGTGQRAYSERRKPENLVEWMREATELESLGDPKAPAPPPPDLLARLLQHGLLCAQPNPTQRPPIHHFLKLFYPPTL